jgi:energy-coupling factor transporter transmembrane protein EcfT
LTFFHYEPSEGTLHRFDPRLKLPLFIGIVVGIVRTSPAGLVLESAVGVLVFVVARLPARRILRETAWFFVLLLVMFIASAIGSSGTEIVPGIPVSVEGVLTGALLVWRLVALVMWGALLAGTTEITMLQAAIVWYLRPFRFIPSGRIATMIGLTISLVPLVFDAYREVADAQLSRGAGSIRNPVRRITLMAVPLLYKTFGRAEIIANAMESRCYSDARTYPPLRLRGADIALFSLGAVIVVAALIPGVLG